MAITLVALENSNVKNLAMMVGLNTFFLFVGFMISQIPYTMNNYIVIILSIIFAEISIHIAMNKYDSMSKDLDSKDLER